MSSALLVVLGAVLAVIGGLVREEIKVRRRLRGATRLLIHEIERLFEWLEDKGIDDDEVRGRLHRAIEQYKAALFDVDRVTFHEHLSVYEKLVNAWEAPGDFRKEVQLILKVKPDLERLMDWNCDF